MPRRASSHRTAGLIRKPWLWFNKLSDTLSIYERCSLETSFRSFDYFRNIAVLGNKRTLYTASCGHGRRYRKTRNYDIELNASVISIVTTAIKLLNPDITSLLRAYYEMYKRIYHECRLLVSKRNIKLGNVVLRHWKLTIARIIVFFFWIGIILFVKFIKGKK